MKKTIKAWAVVWTDKAATMYGVPSKDRIVTVEPQEQIKVPVKGNKNKYLTATSLAIFQKRAEAVAFNQGNVDWNNVPCTITYDLPAKSKRV